MAGEVYRLQFDDANENEITVDIIKSGYTGAMTEIIGGANPCMLRMLGEGDSKFSHIKATECVLELVSTTSLQYLPLFTEPAKTYRVSVYRGSDPLWNGWINPDFYTEPFLPPPYVTTVTATDGIALLKNVDYPITAGTFRQNVITIIANCLKEIGLPNEMTIKVALGLSATTNADGVVTSRLLEKLFIDYRAFRDGRDWTTWSCYDVLNEILSSFNARLFQYADSWHIERIDHKKDVYDVEVYDHDGVYQSTVSDYNAVVALTAYSTGDIIRFINTPARLEVQPAYKGFHVEQEYGERKNLLPFSNFEGAFLEEDFTGLNTLRYWDNDKGTEQAILVKTTSKNDPNKRLLKMKGINYALGQVPAFTAYISPKEAGSPASPYQWTYNEGAINESALMDWVAGTGSLRLKWKAYANWSEYSDNPPGMQVLIRLLLNCSGNIYIAWFTPNQTEEYEWVLLSGSGSIGTQSHINYQLPKDDWWEGETRFTCPAAEVGNFQTYVGLNLLISAPNLSAGSLGINDGILYEYIQLYFSDDKEEERVRFYDAVIDDENILEADEYKFKFGDVPLPYETKPETVDGGVLVNKYAFFDSGSETVNKFGNGTTHDMSLYSQIIYSDLNLAYRRPLFKLRGTIVDTALGGGETAEGHLDFRTILNDYNDRYYFPTGLTYNLKHCTFDGEWLQMYVVSGTKSGELGEYNNDFSDDFFT